MEINKFPTKRKKKEIEKIRKREKTTRKNIPLKKATKKMIYDHGTPGFGSDLTEGKKTQKWLKDQVGHVTSIVKIK